MASLACRPAPTSTTHPPSSIAAARVFPGMRSPHPVTRFGPMQFPAPAGLAEQLRGHLRRRGPQAPPDDRQ
eukprot:11198149-Lingulodinium_polyedra.AAC.1